MKDNDRAEWVSRLQVNNGRGAPSLYQAGQKRAPALEGQQVDRAQHEAIPGVEIGQPALGAKVAEILRLRIRTAD